MINITRPQFNQDELGQVAEVLQSGWVTRGEKVTELEELIKQYTGAKYAIAVNSCTSALHLALLALGIGQGDEVIVPAFTWVATANVVEMVGAKPIFCDIDLTTYNINVDLIENLITPKTRAIIPVHLFGLSADMKPIMKLARKYNLYVIEDAACSLGTFYDKRHTGTIGDIGCFSLHPRKSITTGEGGIITTNSKKLYDLMFSLHDHGAPKFDKVGYNYRMNDIQGAVGVAQMKKLGSILTKRKLRAEVYNKFLGDTSMPYVPCYSNHSYQSYIVLCPHRDWLMTHFEENDIAARQGTQNVPLLPYYKNKYKYKDENFPCSTFAEMATITLPLYADMTEEEQNKVLEVLSELH